MAVTQHILFVVTEHVRYQGGLRSMTAKEREFAAALIARFPGMMSIASRGQLKVNAHAVFKTDVYELDDALLQQKRTGLDPWFWTINGQKVPSGEWLSERIGDPSLTRAYGGEHYDGVFVIVSENQIYARNIFGLTIPGWSYIQVTDDKYDRSVRNNQTEDVLVHEYLHQIGEIMIRAGIPLHLEVDRADAYGYEKHPRRGWMDFLRDFMDSMDYTKLRQRPAPVMHHAAVIVPFTPVNLDDPWPQGAAPPTEPPVVPEAPQPTPQPQGPRPPRVSPERPDRPLDPVPVPLPEPSISRPTPNRPPRGHTPLPPPVTPPPTPSRPSRSRSTPPTFPDPPPAIPRDRGRTKKR